MLCSPAKECISTFLCDVSSSFATCLYAKMSELGLLLWGEFFYKVAFNQWSCRCEQREHLSIVQDLDRSLEVRGFYYSDYTTYLLLQRSADSIIMQILHPLVVSVKFGTEILICDIFSRCLHKKIFLLWFIKTKS